jgi:hypothetical protein
VLHSKNAPATTYDYLFVDEAGQVSFGNLVAMAGAAENIVLLGDQMQLPQPVQGVHPGETGLSSLEYLLEDKATVPEDRGIFLNETRRLHPASAIVLAWSRKPTARKYATLPRSTVALFATREAMAAGIEVACHNDPSPCNTVFRDGQPIALIDFRRGCSGSTRV